MSRSSSERVRSMARKASARRFSRGQAAVDMDPPWEIRFSKVSTAENSCPTPTPLGLHPLHPARFPARGGGSGGDHRIPGIAANACRCPWAADGVAELGLGPVDRVVGDLLPTLLP